MTSASNTPPITGLLHRFERAVDAIGVRAVIARERVWWSLRTGEPELGLLSLLGDRGADFLDVGANRGIYAYCALRHFRTVIAAEANPAMVAGLRRIIKRENTVLSVALSDAVGETTLHIPTHHGRDVSTRCSLQRDANPGFGLRTVTVPTTTIDELALARVGVIKIDVEGHESAVLRGARQTLRATQPTCIVECEERHNTGGVARTFAFFDTMGYRGYFLHRGRLRAVADFDITQLQRPENAKPLDGTRSGDYVNNFVFIHADNDGHLEKIGAAFGTV